jgi:hypothetical protein
LIADTDCDRALRGTHAIAFRLYDDDELHTRYPDALSPVKEGWW